MKRMAVGLGLLLILTASAPGWQPSGWVYANYPYMYDHASGDWYWFGANNAQWTNPLAGGAWARLNESPLAQGWSWYTGRYAYHSPTHTWHYFSFNGRHKCVNLRTGVWSVFTVPPAGDFMVIDLSAGPGAATYPVQYYQTPADVPDGVAHNRYKTTHLLLRRIPAGTFTMGSPAGELGRDAAREAQRQVTLTKNCYIGVFEVSQKQWERVMGYWPGFFSNADYRETRPVESVSWDSVRGGTWPGDPLGSGEPSPVSFVGRVRTRTGLPTDLPTEAQWEYACRSGTTSALNSGKNLTGTTSCPNMDEVGRYGSNHPGGYSGSSSVSTDGGTAKMGSYLPNAWGLYDMHGNVWEWCLDWYVASPSDSTDPTGPATGSVRVARGGAWYYNADDCRSASRNNGLAGNSVYGFRLVQTVP